MTNQEIVSAKMYAELSMKFYVAEANAEYDYLVAKGISEDVARRNRELAIEEAKEMIGNYLNILVG